MQHIGVFSSSLSSVGYDAASRQLEIMFHDGRLYGYFDVPQHVYQGLMQAASHGTYFCRHIRDNYRYQRVR